MSSLNKVQIIGRLGANPEVRYTPQGEAACTISVATSESWKDKQTGEKKELTEWHRVSMFGRLAEIAGEYLAKGSLVYVEGSLRTRKWLDKQSGQEKYATEVRCDQMRMLSSKGDTGGSQRSRDDGDRNESRDRTESRGGYGQQQGNTAQRGAPSQNRSTSSGGAPKSSTGFDDMDDDIPFITAAFDCDEAHRLTRRMARRTFR